jgi:hypothetical protein
MPSTPRISSPFRILLPHVGAASRSQVPYRVSLRDANNAVLVTFDYDFGGGLKELRVGCESDEDQFTYTKPLNQDIYDDIQSPNLSIGAGQWHQCPD